MNHGKFFCLILALSILPSSLGAKEIISLDQGWGFSKGTLGMEKTVWSWKTVPVTDTTVNLPHTWNASDFMDDGGYYRGYGSYLKKLDVPESWRGRRIFIRFDGAGSDTYVFINGKAIGTHKGAYNSFVFELTDHLDYEGENWLVVTCDNSLRFDTAPLHGDFNHFGGLYRDVWLEISEDTCISPLHFGSRGLFMTQNNVTPGKAFFRAETFLSTTTDYTGCEVEFTIYDAEGKTVTSQTTPYINNGKAQANMVIDSPRLWNGVEDPYLYKISAVLLRNGSEIDREEDRFGVRTYFIDPEKGFFLNGKHLKLRGVCRHQEWAGIGSALKKENHVKDLDLIQEMGANAMRLSHYPQAHFIFEEADRRGLVIWDEIPFVGGYMATREFDDNLKLQLTELILQNLNHPSICFWGLFNEIRGDFDRIATELNDLAHSLDPTRLTTSATCFDGSFNFISDVLGWNKYFGWYDDTIATFATFFDSWHEAHPDRLTCVSEYGGGAAFSQHIGRYVENGPVDKQVTRGRWHPMEWQTAIHIADLKMIAERDWIWGSFLWVMFDFGSSQRTEGDTNNLNDKGLVTQDRTRRKDAFYLYKANWNKSVPTVHLCSKDYVDRKEDVTDIIVFTTAPSAKLVINGRSQGTVKTDAFATARWDGVTLSKGKNVVEIKTAAGNDSATWYVAGK